MIFLMFCTVQLARMVKDMATAPPNIQALAKKFGCDELSTAKACMAAINSVVVDG